MKHRLHLTAHFACALSVLVGFGAIREAKAQTPFIDSGIVWAETTCNAFGQPFIEKATGAYTGYFSGVAPRAGQVTYIHAVASSSSGCFNSDTVGLEVVLPANARYAISPTTPVICYRGHDSVYEQVPDSSSSACLQSPTQGARGLFFGYSVLPSANSSTSGWWLEIQVPVIFDTTGTHTVTSWAKSAYTFPGNSNYGGTTVNVSVLSSMSPPPTPPTFGNYSATSNSSGDAVNVTFSVTTNFQVGDVDIEWGTTTSFGQVTDPARTFLLEMGYPNSTGTLINTPSSTTIYWRPRFTVGGMRFYGATQSIRTNAFPAPRPFPTFPRPCRGFCAA